MEQKIFSVPVGIIALGFGALCLVLAPLLVPAMKTSQDSWHFRRLGEHAWMTFFPLSHLVIYFIISVLFPTHWFFLFNFGLAWELIEFGLTLIVEKNKHWTDAYWYANLFDIVMNSIGIYLGTCLGMVWKLRKNKQKQKTWWKLFFIGFIVSMVVLFGDDQHYYISRDPEGIYKKCGCRFRCDFIEKNGNSQ